MEMKYNITHFLSHSKINPVSQFKVPNVTFIKKEKKEKEGRVKERKKERKKKGKKERKNTNNCHQYTS